MQHPELLPAPGGYGDYMIRVFEYVIDNEPGITVLPVEYIVSAVLNQCTPSGCVFPKRCGESFLCVNQEGMIYPCGRYAGDKRSVPANIHKGSNQAGRKTLEALKVLRSFWLPARCKSYRYVNLCSGGCPMNDGIQCSMNCCPLT